MRYYARYVVMGLRAATKCRASACRTASATFSPRSYHSLIAWQSSHGLGVEQMGHGKLVIHASVTLDRVIKAAHDGMTGLDSPGICLACGADADGVEPDARRYECEACGENAVYGGEELVIMVA